MRKVFLGTLLFLTLAGSMGCARGQNTSSSDSLTVEGYVSMRGHEPFTALMLETDNRNVYVLALDEQERAAILPQTPDSFQVSGELYKDDWNGKPYAHLRVTEWKTITP